MNYIKSTRVKFSIALTMAICLALPVLASAQTEKTLFYSTLDGAEFASRHSGGVNVAFGDGSVRFLSSAAGGGATEQWVEASRISLPNSPLEYDFVDASDPNAENKARALFDAAYRLKRAVVVSLAQGTLDAGRVSAATFFISDGGDSNLLEVKLPDALISSYQVGGGSDGAATTVAINFTKIKFDYRPYN